MLNAQTVIPITDHTPYFGYLAILRKGKVTHISLKGRSILCGADPFIYEVERVDLDWINALEFPCRRCKKIANNLGEQDAERQDI